MRFIRVDMSGLSPIKPIQIDVGAARDTALLTGGHDPTAPHPPQRPMVCVEKVEDHTNIPGLGGVVFDCGGPIDQAPVELRPTGGFRMPRLFHHLGVEFFDHWDDARDRDGIGGRRHGVRDP